MTIDELLLEWSYRSEKGYPSLDNPSDLSILREILIRLNIPSDKIISEIEGLEKSPKGSDEEKIETEPYSPDDKPDEKVSVDDIISLLDTIKDDGKALKKIKQLILNMPASKDWDDNLSKSANITSKTIDTSNAPKDILDILTSNDDLPAYSEYLKNPINFGDLPTEGNLIDEFQDIGISQDSLVKLFDFKGAESGRGVGKGEMALASLCGDVKMAAAGAGDLSWNGKSLEVKGSNARLGGRDRKFTGFEKTPLGQLAIKYDKSDAMLYTLIPNLANEEDINLDELLEAVIDFEETAHPGGNATKYFTKDILSDGVAIKSAFFKNLILQYTSKHNIDHLIFINSNVGKNFGNYYHFTPEEAEALVDAEKIKSNNIAIHQLDPSLSKP
jgi:hypothetical protein